MSLKNVFLYLLCLLMGSVVVVTAAPPQQATPIEQRNVYAEPLQQPIAQGNLLLNSDFSQGTQHWNAYGNITSGVYNGEMRFHRHKPGWKGATVFQKVSQVVPSGTPLQAQVDIGNMSNVSKGVEVVLRHPNFQQQIVCSVTMPPNTPLTTVTIQDVMKIQWPEIFFGVRSLDGDGISAIRMDNASVAYTPNAGINDFWCSGFSTPTNTQLLSNGNFQNNFFYWILWGDYEFNVIDGVMNFYRSIGATRPAVLLNNASHSIPANAPLQMYIKIGNNSDVSRDVNVVLRDSQWAQQFSCTYTVPANAPLTNVRIQGKTTASWSNPMVLVRSLDADGKAAILVDDANLQYMPTLTVTATCSTPDFTPPTPEEEVLDLVNQARCAEGLVPLVFNSKLNAAAKRHSDDMAYNMVTYISHTGTDDSSMSDRVDDTGYNWSRLGENIAAAYNTPQAVFNGWWGSPGHRANMMNPDFRDIGIVLTKTNQSMQYYWTQVFGTTWTPANPTCASLGYGASSDQRLTSGDSLQGVLGEPLSIIPQGMKAPITIKPDVGLQPDTGGAAPVPVAPPNPGGIPEIPGF